jgi:tRNA(Arg) A34 adenosine deaminase TadA
MTKPFLQHMKAAIEIAEKHETPFGAALAMGDQLFVAAANETTKLHDPTAHAEIMAIRKLGEHLKKTDLSGYTLYTTCEPCPMCMSAAIWSKIDTIFYGCDIPMISDYMRQIQLRADTLAESAFVETHVRGEIMIDECEELLKKYS